MKLENESKVDYIFDKTMRIHFMFLKVEKLSFFE